MVSRCFRGGERINKPLHGSIILIFGIALSIALTASVLYFIYCEVTNPTYVEGIFIDGYYKEANSPDGYFTVIKLKNYTVTGNIKPVNKNEFIYRLISFIITSFCLKQD